MKIFLSWSGEVSQQVALVLEEWLPTVIQSLDPWISSSDIESGTRWQERLFRELEADQFGIACLTKENLRAPWLNFEAGALAKQLSSAHVVPFLFDMRGTDLPANHPFTTFNYIAYDPEEKNPASIYKLLSDINLVNPEKLTDTRLQSAFAAFWPQLQSRFEEIYRASLMKGDRERPAAPLDINVVLSELLELARKQDRTLARFTEVEALPMSGRQDRSLRLQIAYVLHQLATLPPVSHPGQVERQILRIYSNLNEIDRFLEGDRRIELEIDALTRTLASYYGEAVTEFVEQFIGHHIIADVPPITEKSANE